ncbi:SDR family NAD(P)-dependent oxidoreductase [Nocardioides sambongensis]|uniref:SDR family NAD(P)-dependent oxidoreductase n=1 Tax=Nocardioides sambongensis TaxID=2589074 RepID=UPI00112C69A4|nr:SDR family NAD(P)-dependent oxidoreductase [Nocardioides sambongensis]
MTVEELAGRTAVVTGAGSGIGRGIALHAAQVGMNVVLADIEPSRLAEAVEECRGAGARAIGVVTDVTDAAAVEALAEAAYAEFGEVGLLVNNAGIETLGYVWDLTPESWSRMMRINTDGVFHGIRAFVPRMGAAAQRSYVVNTGSVASVTSGPMNAAYHASKHATLALTECLSLECQARYPQIQVSALLPGSVDTHIFADASIDGGDEPAGPEGMRNWLLGSLSSEGLTPASVAKTVFDGILAGDFWLLPHEEQFDEFVTRRSAMLTEKAAPELPALG